MSIPNSFFRDLDLEEESKFRQWARDNWEPNKEPNPCWHPVVRDEWQKVTEDYKSIDRW